MLQFILDLLTILPLLILPYFFGLDDGIMKRKKTEAHWPKWIMFACFAWMIIYDYEHLTLLGWLILWKPAFDYGWSKGAGFVRLYIGKTSWTDRFIRKIIPLKFLPAVYCVLIFTGYLLMYHLNFRI